MKTKWLSTIINFADKNSNVILTTGTALGVVGTGILSGLGAIKYTNLVDAKENRTKKPLNKKEKFGIAAKTLWPAVAVGTVTIVLTVSNCKITSKKTAALAAAYTLPLRSPCVQCLALQGCQWYHQPFYLRLPSLVPLLHQCHP